MGRKGKGKGNDMKISKSNLLARIYRFNFVVLSDGYASCQTDLCHFVRVILLYLPLKILIKILMIIGGIGSALFAVGFVFFVFSAIYLYSYLIHVLLWGSLSSFFIGWYIKDNFGGEISQAAYAASQTKPMTAAKILGEWVSAKKKKICPVVMIEDD